MKLSHQLQRFIVTGLVNTAFSYSVYVLFDAAFHWSYFWAATAAWCVGVCFSYMMFRAFVFTEGDRSWRSFKRFLPTYVFLLVINLIGLHILVSWLHWNELLAQAFMVAFCSGLSFIINRLFVFK